MSYPRLKSSKLPEQAAAAELRHREELETETHKALQAAKDKRNQAPLGAPAVMRVGNYG